MKIGYVDDQSSLLALFTNAFAQKGIALITWEFSLDQKEEIMQSVLGAELDVLLLDYHLSSSYKGRDFSKDVRSYGCRAILVGFSTDPYTAPLFAKVGVSLFVQKRSENSDCSVKEVIDIMDMALDIKSV